MNSPGTAQKMFFVKCFEKSPEPKRRNTEKRASKGYLPETAQNIGFYIRKVFKKSGSN